MGFLEEQLMLGQSADAQHEKTKQWAREALNHMNEVDLS